MKFNYATNKISYVVLLMLITSLASCGSYEYAGRTTDGIYDSDNYETYEYPVEVERVTETGNDNFYKNYFADKSKEYEMILNEEDDIFTDVDSYKSEYTDQQLDSLQYDKGYAGWGENNTDVSINIYNNNWGSWGWNNWAWGRPWGWNRWGWNTWGWNNWGWNGGFGLGFVNHSWGFWGGWSNPYPFFGYPVWGAGFYDPWVAGFYDPLYHQYYQGMVYSRGYTYNRSRRGTLLNSNFNRTSRIGSTDSRRLRSTTPRSRFTSPNSNNPRSFTRPRDGSSRPTTTPRSNSPRRKTSVPQSSTPRPRYNSNNNSSAPRTYTPSSSSSSPRSMGSSPRSSSSGGRRGG